MGTYLSTTIDRNAANTDVELSSDENTVTDHGYWLNLDRDFTVIPPEHTCFYCSKEGKVHPLEHFACYPCCGYKICLDCMKKNSTSCGECLTNIPRGNENAILWIQARMARGSSMYKTVQHHLVGRCYIQGCHTFLDELVMQPIYERQRPPNQIMAIMNPPNVQIGVNNLMRSAEDGSIAAMLDLADTFTTSFYNDDFSKDKKKAEFWYRRALGYGNKIFPLAFTRYGEYLMWESRFLEAKNMFQVAATYGHAKGQYYYAHALLEEHAYSQKKIVHENGSLTHYDDVTEAIEWLCKASQKGFYCPSYFLLAKTLIEVAEKVYGDARINGKSPLPRALQMLSLVKEGGYGCSSDVVNQAQELTDRYNNCQKKCCNCGAIGNESLPLITCPGCGVLAFCSNMCRKRYFRYGHKFDCCSRDRIFDFHQIKCVLLPWIKKDGPIDEEIFLTPPVSDRRSLTEMVEDDTDATYGDEELEYDEHIITQLMLRMRKNLEKYLGRAISAEKETNHENRSISPENRRNLALTKQIDLFSKANSSLVSKEFVDAMHKIREYGNRAAHYSPNDQTLEIVECEEAVRVYIKHKEDYERMKNEKARVDVIDQKDEQVLSATTHDKKESAQKPKKNGKKSKKKSGKKK